MDEKKSLMQRFKDLSKPKKLQLVMASLLTLVLVIGIPVYAWFSYSSNIETLAKIKAPTTLDIKSGHAYSIEYLDLSDIDASDVDENGVGSKDYIFAVKAGSSISSYDIQIAHTTNIPFTYELYRASELGEGNNPPPGTVATFVYHNEQTEESISYYYGYASNSSDSEDSVAVPGSSKLELTDLNPDGDTFGRILGKKNDASGIYSEKTGYSGADDPQLYAVPLYSQHTGIKTWNPAADYFILRLKWNTKNDNTAFAKWNAAENNKETDMIYISAKASAGSG